MGKHPFGKLAEGRLIWLPELGCGFFPVQSPVYDQAYFDRFAAMSSSDIGRQLNAFRVLLVNQYTAEPLIDVGIGAGAFLLELARDDSFGFDVNPAGVSWLTVRGLYRDFWSQRWRVATFWDSLEHMPDPEAALARVTNFAFVSLPIFRGAEHAVRSKHFRPTEHYWYWTRDGFCRFAARSGFEVRDVMLTESVLGRKDIETFVLQRRETK